MMDAYTLDPSINDKTDSLTDRLRAQAVAQRMRLCVAILTLAALKTLSFAPQILRPLSRPLMIQVGLATLLIYAAVEVALAYRRQQRWHIA